MVNLLVKTQQQRLILARQQYILLLGKLVKVLQLHTVLLQHLILVLTRGRIIKLQQHITLVHQLRLLQIGLMVIELLVTKVDISGLAVDLGRNSKKYVII